MVKHDQISWVNITAWWPRISKASFLQGPFGSHWSLVEKCVPDLSLSETGRKEVRDAGSKALLWLLWSVAFEWCM